MKYFIGALFLFFMLSSISYAQEVEEVVVTGTPPSNDMGPAGLSWGVDIGAMTQHMIWEMQHAQSVQAGRSVYERIKQCHSNADAAGKQCEGAYNQLNTLCNAYVGAVGGGLVSGFFKKIGVELSTGLSTAITMGSAGYASDQQVYGCDYLVNQAMTYCANGVAKMKSACK